ncbi:TPA: AAA family ATPase [Legionella pneumophila]|nr:AAA family ATPase [Legionella pneumophila]
MNFKKLEISEWQQFQNINIDFHNRLTILTGANGSGKTTILANILARHQNWSIHSLATPKKIENSSVVSFLTRLFNGQNKSHEKAIGELSYDNNLVAALEVPNQNSPQYHITIKNQQSVNCFFMPSHRPPFRYQPINNIPYSKKNTETAFQEVSEANKAPYLGNNNSSNSFFMKSSLIGWAIQGYGIQNNEQEIMPRDEEQIQYFEGFQEVLRRVLPKTLGFRNFEIREREIVFVCNQGKDEFILEQASGGISALIDIAWQIYMFAAKEKSTFTVIIDEVENHLHPIMQRQIMPDLLNAFPNTCFIVSTHSPLVVGSVRDSNVYVLKYNNENKIISNKLDLVNQAKTATEILDEVLGVTFTIPIWAEKELQNIIHAFSQKEMTKSDFTEMRTSLKTIGLERFVPQAIENILDKKND